VINDQNGELTEVYDLSCVRQKMRRRKNMSLMHRDTVTRWLAPSLSLISYDLMLLYCHEWPDVHNEIFVAANYIHDSDAGWLWTSGNIPSVLSRSMCSMVIQLHRHCLLCIDANSLFYLWLFLKSSYNFFCCHIPVVIFLGGIFVRLVHRVQPILFGKMYNCIAVFDRNATLRRKFVEDFDKIT